MKLKGEARGRSSNPRRQLSRACRCIYVLVLAGDGTGLPHKYPYSGVLERWLLDMVPAVLNLYVDKSFVQLCKKASPFDKAEKKRKFIHCRQMQSIDLVFHFSYLVEWQCLLVLQKVYRHTGLRPPAPYKSIVLTLFRMCGGVNAPGF